MSYTPTRSGFRLVPGPLAEALAAEKDRAARAAKGLWRKDPSTWSRDEAVQSTIANRLGWLASPALMTGSVDRMRACAEDVRRAGFEDVVVLGMGGSSLAPEVLRALMGRREGWPRLQVLDSTDPAAVRAIGTNPARTAFLLASKSGTTIEPNALAAHFRGVLEAAGVSNWASHFIAITDAGTALAERARVDGFRDVFINPGDIGGRYSAISYFGLLPAALMGHDVAAIVTWAARMLEASQAEGPVELNPAVGLGLLMAAGARSGRDKMTLVVPSWFEPFGVWVEQLVAESTGKQGVGVVPIAGETLGGPEAYGDDRVFVRIRVDDVDDEKRRDHACAALGDVPSATIDVPELPALGAEFVRWEIATAVAGALLGVNPFDEPNVQQAKDATRVLLGRYTSDGRLPSGRADFTSPDASFTFTSSARAVLQGQGPAAFLNLLHAGDYLSLLAYLGPDPALADALRHFRMSVRDRTKTATQLGYGPRYLHSTGQLHKGGPNTGVFVLVTVDASVDLDIPHEPYSFGTLERAQALGDFSSLDAADRRGLHVHLSDPSALTLRRALDTLLGSARSA